MLCISVSYKYVVKLPVLFVEVLNMNEYHAQGCAMAEEINYQPLTLEVRSHPG
jgi:hypothetical protein